MRQRQHLQAELDAAAQALEAVATEMVETGAYWQRCGADPGAVAWASKVASYAAWWSTRLYTCAANHHH